MKKFQFKGIPTFRIKDYKKAIEFYVDFLGFSIDWEHRFGDAEPVYMQVSNNGPFFIYLKMKDSRLV